MHKALIVDDEPRILSGLGELIQWEEYGIEIAGLAGSGAEALHMLEAMNVSILITDIHMPEMNGLELIRRVGQIDDSVKTIVLSGYDDFHYVKEATKLGIENYLLKPVNREELSSTLLSVVEKINQEAERQRQIRSDAHILRNNILNRCMTNNISYSNLAERAGLLQLDLSSTHYTVCLIKLLFHEKHDQAYRGLMQYAGENICSEVLASCTAITFCDVEGRIVALFHGNQPIDSAQIKGYTEEAMFSIRKFLKCSAFAAIGSEEPQIQDAHRSYYNACQLMDYSLIYPPDTVVSYEEVAKSHFGAHRHAVIDHNRFHECLVKKDLESAMQCVDDSFRQWRSQDWMSPVIVQSSAVEMVYRSLNALHALNMDTAPLLVDEDNLFLHQLRTKSIEELHGWVKSVAERTIRMIISLEESIHPLVRRVLAYVDDLYSENISLKTIAHTFNVNVAYLGQLFIKEKNETFSSYLNMKRIEKAKELLCSTSLELQEIAESVGYVNQSYFNSIFKKATGIYPTKYRLDHKNTSL